MPLFLNPGSHILWENCFVTLDSTGQPVWAETSSNSDKAAISQRFSIPTNDDDFEQMCLELLRRHWSRPALELFGASAVNVSLGIDILDLGGELPIYAAQCKLKEEHKSLLPSEIKEEVEKARAFAPALGKYAILTTGKVSTQAQLTIREINQSHKADGLFEVSNT